jgi:hypothetical protein
VASADGATLYVSTLGGTLWGLDRATGRPNLEVPLGARAYGTPCVGPDGTIYVGIDGGAFFAIAADGRVKWRLETPADADTAATLTDDGTVVFAAGSEVYGLRAGVVSFRFHAKDKVFTAAAVTRTSAGVPLVIVGSQDDDVYAITSHGDVAWSVALGHDVDGSPAVGDDGAIYVGTDGDEVVRLSNQGRIEWKTGVGGPVRGALSVTRSGDVLAGVYGPSPRLVRISKGGEILVSVRVRGNGTRETGVLGGALEDDDGALAFGAQDGVVRVVERSGAERWTYDAHAEVDAPLTLLNVPGATGELVVASYAGDVTLLRARE